MFYFACDIVFRNFQTNYINVTYVELFGHVALTKLSECVRRLYLFVSYSVRYISEADDNSVNVCKSDNFDS